MIAQVPQRDYIIEKNDCAGAAARLYNKKKLIARVPRQDYTIEKNVLRRCRGEMYDRDIQLLQFCAATLPPDEFLVHCLNKFGLVAWAAKVRSKSRRFTHQMSSLYHFGGRTVSRVGYFLEGLKYSTFGMCV
jgi:hypothetical protein